MTRAVRAALGALAAALVVGAAAPEPRTCGAVAVLVAAAAAAAWMRGRSQAQGGSGGGVHTVAIPMAALVGAALVLGRAAAGPAGPPGAGGPLPDRVDGPGRIVSVSAPRDGRQRFVVQLDATAVVLDARGPRYPEVSAGARVTVAGRVRPPGDDAYGRSLAARGIAGTLDARTLALAAPDGGPGALLAAVRDSADRALRASVPEPAGGLAAGVLLGLRERVPRDVSADFVATGLSHVVAISGWNIAIVAAALAVAMRRLGRRRRTVATLGAICLYVALVGATPPVIRAALMAATVMTAREAGRAAAAPTALACAVVAMLMADPAAANDPGFRLSTAATAGLLVWGTPLTERLRVVRGRNVHPWLAETLGVSLAAQAATLPLILSGFGRVSLVSPVVNLVVAPFVAPAMAAGAVALGCGMAVAGLPGPMTALAAVAGIPAWVTFGTIIAIAGAGARVPFASVTVDPPWDTLFGIIAAVALVAFGTARGRLLVRSAVSAARPGRRRRAADGGPGPAALIDATDHGSRTADAGAAAGPPAGRSRAARPPAGRSRTARPGASGGRGRRVRPVALALAVAAAGLAFGATRAADGRAHLTVLDVGQGDAILIAGERGGRVLVDGGPDPDRLIAALDARVPPWDRRIDLVVVSHPHEDHAAGLAGLLGRYRIGRVVGSGLTGSGPGWAAWAAGLADRGIPSSVVGTGDHLAVDGIRLTVLWPDGGTVSGRAGDDGRVVNDTSVVLLGEVAGVRFLLPGDAEDDVDPSLVARGVPHVALYKVAHHGSRTASSDALLTALTPSVAVVSVGAGNTYGHPSPRTLARLAAHGATVLRTDRSGAVTAWFAAGRMEVRAERPPEAGGLGYHRRDDRPRARRVGDAPPLARPAAVVPPARPRGRGDRRVARRPHRGGRPARGTRPRRVGRAPPRRRQAAARRSGHRGATPRDRVGGVARAARPPGARGGGGVPCGDPARGSRRDRAAARRPRRGADRGLRGQARGTAARVDGCPLRVVGPPIPGRRVRRVCARVARADAGECERARGGRVRPRGGPPRGGPATSLDRPRAHGRQAQRRGEGGRWGAGRRRARHYGAGRRRGAAMMDAPAVPVILVTGDDAFGIEREARRFAAEVADLASLRTVRVVGVARPASLAEERAATVLESVATGSLFGEGAFVVVTDAPALMQTDASGRALLDAVGLVADGNVLALLALADESGRPRAGGATLEKAVRAAGGVVRSVRLPADLERWIAETAPGMGVRLARGAAAEIARRLGGMERTRDVDRRGMAAEAAAELTKLGLYREGGEVSVEDVQAMVAERVPASVFDLLDAIATRRAHQAVRLLERAATSVPGPVLVVRIHRRLREIAIVEDMTRRGTKATEIARALEWKGEPSKVEWRVGNLQRQAAAWTADGIAAALDGLLAVDAAMKGDGTASERAQRLALVLWIVERVAPR